MKSANEAILPGPTITYQAKFPVTLKAGDYDLQTTIMDFAKEAVVPDHTHGGSVFGVVLNGEMTLKEKGGQRVIRAGESWTEGPGYVHSAVNSGAVPTRIVVSILMPRGAEATTIVKP